MGIPTVPIASACPSPTARHVLRSKSHTRHVRSLVDKSGQGFVRFRDKFMARAIEYDWDKSGNGVEMGRG